MSNDNPTMNGHENYDERASNETKQKKPAKNRPIFNITLGFWN